MEDWRTGNSRTRALPRGTILLEVVLAVALFVGMGSVILAAVGRSADAAVRMRLRAQAADLAVTLTSELEMGLLELVDAGPSDYPSARLAEWNWLVEVEPLENQIDTLRVKATVTHAPTGLARTLVRLLPAEEGRLALGEVGP